MQIWGRQLRVAVRVYYCQAVTFSGSDTFESVIGSGQLKACGPECGRRLSSSERTIGSNTVKVVPRPI